MTHFNPQQQEAIDALGTNVIVSASAGAGKTTVLIARLMKRILKDNVRIDEVCAMTFTEAAASEMKTRLLISLNMENERTPTDFLKEQIALVETAQISTIHSFCLTLIKNYGYIVGIDPARSETILNEGQTLQFQREAMRSVMNTWYHNRYNDLKMLLDYFGASPIDTRGLESTVHSLSIWIMSKKNPEIALSDARNNYLIHDFNALPESFKSIWFHEYGIYVSQLVVQLQELISIIDSDYEEEGGLKFIKKVPLLLEHIELAQTLLKKIERRDISFYDEIPTVFNVTIPPDGQNDRYSRARKKTTSLIASLIEQYSPMDDQVKRLNEEYSLVDLLLTLSEDYLDAYAKIKVRENAFDFNDFESLALKILTVNDGEIASLVQKKYKEIMVDEFQDTNEYQDEFIQRISNGSNIFRVGDIKQSIYRFRGAKPNIMQNLMTDEETHNLYLSFNYRSKDGIVSFNNYVFDKLMNLTYGSSYTEHDHVNVGIPSQHEDSHPVQIHFIETLGDVTLPKNKNQLQAQHIAQEIIAYNKRGFKFKDMVILVRSHFVKAFLKEAFEEYNIPHYIDDRAGFYNSEVITGYVALFNYATQPNDYDLVQLLGSPLFSFTDNDLALLKINAESTLYQSLKSSSPLVYKIIHDTIQSWDYKDLVSIVQDSININNAYQERFSLQDKTNADFLLEKAIEFQKGTSPTLHGFVEFIADYKENTASEATPLNEDADIVTAMTIHQSKGLQFPIVFLWGTRNGNVISFKDSVLVDELIGVGHTAKIGPYERKEKTILRNIIEMKQKNEELEENLRLLYVALTRPQNHLVLVDTVDAYEPHVLDYSFLVSHARRQDLLAAASPDNTIIKCIDANNLGNDVYASEITYEDEDIFKKDLNLEVNNAVISITNEPLNFDRSTMFAMEFGSVLHEAVETLPHELWSSEILSTYEKPIQDRLRAYNQHELTQHIYSFPIIEHEMPFVTKEQSGIIDFYAMDDSHIILVDFKSDNANPDEILTRYRDQLLGYKKALGIIYPEHSLEMYIYSFHHNNYICCLDS